MKTALCSSILASLLLISGCAITGEAEDKWDEEEKEDKISLDGLLGSKEKKENDALKARIEKLERGNNTVTPTVDNSVNQLPATSSKNAGGLTPPSMNRGVTSNSSAGSSSNSVSYQEYLRAKNSQSSEYKDFKEYQDWLEFKRQQGQ